MQAELCHERIKVGRTLIFEIAPHRGTSQSFYSCNSRKEDPGMGLKRYADVCRKPSET